VKSYDLLQSYWGEDMTKHVERDECPRRQRGKMPEDRQKGEIKREGEKTDKIIGCYLVADLKTRKGGKSEIDFERGKRKRGN